MRKMLFCLVATMVMGLGVAQANEGDHGKDNNRYRLACQFQGGEAVKGKAAFHACSVLARVCRGNGDEWNGINATAATETPAAPIGAIRDGNDDHHDRDCRSRLRVTCDDHVVYADGALRTHFLGYEFLSGITGNPVLKFPQERFTNEGSDRNDNESRRSFVVPSWLKVGAAEIGGICEARKVRDGDSDDLN